MRLLVIALTAFALAYAARAEEPASALYVVGSYSPARDPEADLAAAVVRAQTDDKRILMILGGDWCVWCHILDRFVHADLQVHQALAQSFVILKVDVSPQNENEAFLRRFPAARGYPHFYVLDSDGEFLVSQDTRPLEQGRSYNAERLIAFARRWRRA